MMLAPVFKSRKMSKCNRFSEFHPSKVYQPSIPPEENVALNDVNVDFNFAIESFCFHLDNQAVITEGDKFMSDGVLKQYDSETRLLGQILPFDSEPDETTDWSIVSFSTELSNSQKRNYIKRLRRRLLFYLTPGKETRSLSAKKKKECLHLLFVSMGICCEVSSKWFIPLQ